MAARGRKLEHDKEINNDEGFKIFTIIEKKYAVLLLILEMFRYL